MSDYGIKTYADLAETCCGMVLANEIASRPLEPVSGDWAPWDEIFQWYIVQDPSFLMEHTDEPVFYDAELGMYVWGVTTYGTSWAILPATHRKGSSIALLPCFLISEKRETILPKTPTVGHPKRFHPLNHCQRPRSRSDFFMGNHQRPLHIVYLLAHLFHLI